MSFPVLGLGGGMGMGGGGIGAGLGMGGGGMASGGGMSNGPVQFPVRIFCVQELVRLYVH